MAMMVDTERGKRRRNSWAWEMKGPCSSCPVLRIFGAAIEEVDEEAWEEEKLQITWVGCGIKWRSWLDSKLGFNLEQEGGKKRRRRHVGFLAGCVLSWAREKETKGLAQTWEKEERGKGVGVGPRKELAWTGHWPEEDEKRSEEGEGCWASVYMGCWLAGACFLFLFSINCLSWPNPILVQFSLFFFKQFIYSSNVLNSYKINKINIKILN